MSTYTILNAPWRDAPASNVWFASGDDGYILCSDDLVNWTEYQITNNNGAVAVYGLDNLGVPVYGTPGRYSYNPLNGISGWVAWWGSLATTIGFNKDNTSGGGRWAKAMQKNGFRIDAEAWITDDFVVNVTNDTGNTDTIPWTNPLVAHPSTRAFTMRVGRHVGRVNTNGYVTASNSQGTYTINGFTQESGLYRGVGANGTIVVSSGVLFSANDEKVSGTTADLYSISHATGDTWYAAGEGVLLKSTDDCQTWTTENQNFGGNIIYSIAADGSNLVAVGNGIVYSSTDSGATWNSTVVAGNYKSVAAPKVLSQ